MLLQVARNQQAGNLWRARVRPSNCNVSFLFSPFLLEVAGQQWQDYTLLNIGIRAVLGYLQQRTHQATQTHFAYSTVKARGPTDDSNGEPILGEVQCGRQIWVISLLGPKSVAQRHGGPVTQWHRRIGVMGLGFGLVVGERKI